MLLDETHRAAVRHEEVHLLQQMRAGLRQDRTPAHVAQWSDRAASLKDGRSKNEARDLLAQIRDENQSLEVCAWCGKIRRTASDGGSVERVSAESCTPVAPLGAASSSRDLRKPVSRPQDPCDKLPRP